ncbi:hypothetical protein SBRCBS47491_004254 [Sporothrix bragantina]|uniref:Major facilitator superfamily (MFS) profile domain-containing protein n=1 Tax=Sporothrix bragantina TaxID=671064 RepID=A0ABP0BLW0_9PEZI
MAKSIDNPQSKAVPVEHPTEERQSVAIEDAAMIADGVENIKVSPWTISMLRLYGCLLVGYLCACMNGYDGSVMGGINGMDSYLQFFHMQSASSSTGIIFAIYNIGTICAVPLVGPVNDYWGRRAGMFSGAVLVIVGTVIVAAAQNHGMFMGGRFVLGFGVSFCNVSGPVYVGEMAHPSYRGVLCGLYNCFWYIGSIVASWVVYAAQNKPSGWRIPLYCQLISSCIIVLFVWTLPDSPRWHMSFGRKSVASKILTRYHGEGNPEHPLVKLQLAEMEYQISTTGSDKKWWDYSELVKTPNQRRRLIPVLTMACFGQWSGNSVSSYYLPVALENAGIVSQNRRLLLNAINSPLCFVAAIAGSFLIDKAGRRPMLLSTLIAITCCFAIITPTSKLAAENPDNSAAGNATIAFIYIFGIIFSFAWTPLSPMYVVECLGTNARAKGKSVAQFVTAASSAIIQYSSGPAFQHIHYYFYCVFIAWNTIEVIVIYFFWPETAGRTLEELSEVFDSPNPVKKSLEAKNMQTVINTMHADTADTKEV